MTTALQLIAPDADAVLSYALRWRVGGVIPGAHQGSDNGQSGRFRQVVPFDRSPDPRRIDLRVSARDPLGRLHVRQFEQRTSASVEVLVDVSASMAFGVEGSRLQRATSLVAAIARAAHAIHDAFGLAACGERIALLHAASRSDAQALVNQLSTIAPSDDSARSLLTAANHLVGRRRLVFLISDFAFPLDEAAALLDALTLHDVVPVCIGENIERTLPKWGLADLADLETGRRRLVVLRPSLRARWRADAEKRKAALSRLCLSRGRQPFVLERGFDAGTFSDHLLGG